MQLVVLILYLITVTQAIYLVYFQAEIQLNLQKRRGHGVLSVLRPKFSGVLGESLDVAARWSGDVVSIRIFL